MLTSLSTAVGGHNEDVPEWILEDVREREANGVVRSHSSTLHQPLRALKVNESLRIVRNSQIRKKQNARGNGNTSSSVGQNEDEQRIEVTSGEEGSGMCTVMSQQCAGLHKARTLVFVRNLTEGTLDEHINEMNAQKPNNELLDTETSHSVVFDVGTTGHRETVSETSERSAKRAAPSRVFTSTLSSSPLSSVEDVGSAEKEHNNAVVEAKNPTSLVLHANVMSSPTQNALKTSPDSAMIRMEEPLTHSSLVSQEELPSLLVVKTRADAAVQVSNDDLAESAAPTSTRGENSAMFFSTEFLRHHKEGRGDAWIQQGALTLSESVSLRREVANLSELLQQSEHERVKLSRQLSEIHADSTQQRLRELDAARRRKLQDTIEKLQAACEQLEHRLQGADRDAERSKQSALALQAASAKAEMEKMELYWKERLRAMEMHEVVTSAARRRDRESWLAEMDSQGTTIEDLQKALGHLTAEHQELLTVCRKQTQEIRLLRHKSNKLQGRSRNLQGNLIWGAEDGDTHTYEDLQRIIEEMGGHQAALLSRLDERDRECRSLKAEHEEVVASLQRELTMERARVGDVIALYAEQIQSLHAQLDEAVTQKRKYMEQLSLIRG